MGQSSSKKQSKGKKEHYDYFAMRHQRLEITKNMSMVQKSEKFIHDIYENFSSVESVNMLLASRTGRNSFKKYLYTIGDEEYLELFRDCRRLILKCDNKTLSNHDFNDLFEEYVYPRNIHKKLPRTGNFTMLSSDTCGKCMMALKLDPLSLEYLSVIRKLCLLLEDEALSILHDNYFKNFLSSKHYSKWRKLEASHAIATSSDDARSNYTSKRNCSSNSLVSYDDENMSKRYGKYTRLKLRENIPGNVVVPITETQKCSILSESVPSPSSRLAGALSRDRSLSALSALTDDNIHATPSRNRMDRRMSKPSNLGLLTHCNNKVTPMSVDNSHFVSSNSVLSCDLDFVNSDRHNQRNQSFHLLDDFSVSAFANIQKTDIDKITANDNWLAVLISASEGLSVGFAFASVEHKLLKQSSSSLLFVNRQFETTTGFNRLNVLGKSASSVLVASKSKNSSMDATLFQGSSCLKTAVVMSERADGEIYQNLLSVKSVFSDSGSVVYQLIIFFDVSKEEDLGKSKIALMNMIMSDLPDYLSSDLSDDDD